MAFQDSSAFLPLAAELPLQRSISAVVLPSQRKLTRSRTVGAGIFLEEALEHRSANEPNENTTGAGAAQLSLRESISAVASPPQPTLVRASTVGAVMSSQEALEPPSRNELIENPANVAAAVVAMIIKRVGADASSTAIYDDCRSAATAVVAMVVERVRFGIFSWKCCICLEQQSGSTLRYNSLCGNPACNDTFCSTCLQAYFTDAASYSRFTVLPLRCPAAECRRRVPTERWANLVPAETLEAYQKGARDSLNFRCPSCHDADSLMVDVVIDHEHRAEAIESFLAQNRRSSFCAERLLRRSWAAFSAGTATADQVLDALLAVLGCNSMLDLSAKQLRQVLSFIPDVERRCALHLACLRKHPLIWTPCCGAEICFRCQLAGHHDGMTCEEIQRNELEVKCQFCPSCGVPTQKTEGCDHIICLCGADWEWQHDEVSADDAWVAPAADDRRAVAVDDWGTAADDWAAPTAAADDW